MKKTCFFIMLFLSFLIMSISTYADTLFDTSDTSKGLLHVTYDGSLTKKIKLTISFPGLTNDYAYDVNSNKKFSVPLQLGNGEYTAKILENISGNSYRIVSQHKFSADIKTPNDMFLTASPIVNYSSDMTAIKEYSKILSGSNNEQINTIYERVVNDYTYDDKKAATVASGYVPVIDEIYKLKKGICYDYSAMMSSVLRSQGVPIKLVMGYAPEIDGYHAWNEILFDGKWIVVDTTYDSAYAHAGQNYSMVKDSKKFKVTRVY